MNLQPQKFIACLLSLSILLVSCEKQKSNFRIATNLWPGYEMLYAARALGYYNNKKIRLIEAYSSSAVQRGLRNETLEAGALTLDEALNLLQDGIDIRILLVIDESVGGDVILAKPSIKNLQDLRGKKIGINNSAVSTLLLDEALFKAGIKTNEIIQIPLTEDEQFQSYIDGNIDALATFEPVRSQLLEKNATILFSSAQISGKILDVLVVRNEAINTYNEEIKSLLDGYFKSLNYFKRNPIKIAEIMKKRLGNNPLKQTDQLHFLTLNENYIYLNKNNPKLKKSAENLKQFMLKRKLLHHNFKLNTIVAPEFLPIK